MTAVRYQRDESVLAVRLGEDVTALFDARVEKHHALEGPMARIWELLEHPRTLQEICDALLAEYDIDPSICAENCARFLQELVTNNLASPQPE